MCASGAVNTLCFVWKSSRIKFHSINNNNNNNNNKNPTIPCCSAYLTVVSHDRTTIRRFLTEDAAKTSYSFSRSDYCKCLFVDASNCVIQPLQKIQNFAARLVPLAPRHHHSTPLLEKLHWLPISERIKYKVACMCFNAINGSRPAYLSELLHVYTPSENPAIHTQDSWLSHFLLLWTPHLEFTPTRP